MLIMYHTRTHTDMMYYDKKGGTRCPQTECEAEFALCINS